MNRFRFSCAILDAEFRPLLPKHDHVTLTNAIENPAIHHNRSEISFVYRFRDSIVEYDLLP